MSATGEMVFFTCTQPPDPTGAMVEVARLAGATRATYAYSSVGESHEWDWFQHERGRPRRSVQGAFVEHSEGPPQVLVARRQPLEALPPLYQPESCLSVALADDSLVETIQAASLQSISEEVRGHIQRDGGFYFSGTRLRLGWHDLFESVEEPGGRLIARPFFSIVLDGTGSPKDWAEYRKRIFQAPEVREAKQSFEAVLGPLDQCVYWSV